LLDKNIIHLGDCLELMQQIDDKSIDMILCDLPYGKTQCNWDCIIPFDQLWEQYERIIKDNGAIVLYAKPPFDKVLAVSNLKLFKYEWIWKKNKSTGHLNSKKMPMQAHENILVFYKSLPTYNPQMTNGHKPMNYAKKTKSSNVFGKEKESINRFGSTDRYPTTILDFPVVNNDSPDRIHPNQKPIELCEYLIKTYTNENELVLDNCSGSASTFVACLNTDRNFIGIEKELKYVQLSNQRIQNILRND
jgi:DNA modification methylase